MSDLRDYAYEKYNARLIDQRGILMANLSDLFPAASGLAAKIKAWYTCEEASGNLLDSVGSNDMTDTNTVGSTTGVVSNARLFAGINSEYFTVSGPANIQGGGLADFFVCGWFNAASLTSYGSFPALVYVGTGTAAADVNYFLCVPTSSGDLTAYCGVGGSFETLASVPISTSTTYHFFMQYLADSHTVKLWVNNGTEYSQILTGNMDQNIGADVIVGRYSSSYFDGWIDELVFGTGVATSGERSWFYNSGSGRTFSDL